MTSSKPSLEVDYRTTTKLNEQDGREDEAGAHRLGGTEPLTEDRRGEADGSDRLEGRENGCGRGACAASPAKKVVDATTVETRAMQTIQPQPARVRPRPSPPESIARAASVRVAPIITKAVSVRAGICWTVDSPTRM